MGMIYWIGKIKFWLALTIGTLFCFTKAFSQEPESVSDSICNKSVVVKRWVKDIPKDVCLPMGYIITDINSKVDFNNDSLDDFIITWNKKKLNDGDTIFVTIFKQMIDSSFFQFRTFSHLYPPIFSSYSLSYLPKDSKLAQLKRKFSPYPLRQIEFKGSNINIRIRIDDESEFLIDYKFDKGINNWIVVSAFEISEFNDTINYAPVFGPTVDEFSYDYWDSLYEFKGWK